MAAATARACAVAGKRTLILSTDPAHSLADSLQQPLGGEPTAVVDQPVGQQIDAHQELTRHWAGVQSWMGQLLLTAGSTGSPRRS